MSVTVVVTAKDDERVFTCLEEVCAQAAALRAEVVLVDGGSNASFMDRLSAFARTRPGLVLLRFPGTVMESWNHGLSRARSDVVVRVDADTLPRPGWLETLVRPLLDRPSLGWSGGRVVGPSSARSLVQRYFDHRTRVFLDKASASPKGLSSLPSWNVAYTRDSLAKVGPFDTWMVSSEDWDLHWRLQRAGFPGAFVDDAVVEHDHPSTLAELFRRERWYHVGQYQFGLKHGFGRASSALLLPCAYLGIVALAIIGAVFPPSLMVAIIAFAALVLEQWMSAAVQRDPTFFGRPIFRLVEAAGGMLGLLQGVIRFGVRRRSGGKPDLAATRPT